MSGTGALATVDLPPALGPGPSDLPATPLPGPIDLHPPRGFGGGASPSLVATPSGLTVAPAVFGADPGFTVAPGDPGQLGAAAAQIGYLQALLSDHANTIQTAPRCAPTWTGEAAQAYANLSVLVAQHFRNAASTAGDAKNALQRWSTELERCQREGMIAVTEAQHWLAEIKTDEQALTTAEGQITSAQQAVTTAHVGLASVHGPAAHLYQQAATSAQQSLTTAQTAAQTARTKLTHDHEQLALWQRRGRQAWDHAEAAAERATGSLDLFTIVPPPLAGLPVPLSPIPTFAGQLEPNCAEPDTATANAKSGGLAGRLAAQAARMQLTNPLAAAALLALAKALEDGEVEEQDLAGTLIPSEQEFDSQAHALAGRIGGDAQVEFATGPNADREFDAVSSEYVAQSKPANFALSQSFRVQAKATFQAAMDTGRTPYFQFDSPPQPGVLRVLARYAQRYGIQPVIDTRPLDP